MTEVIAEKPAFTEQRVAVVQVVNEPRPAIAALTPFTLVGEPDTDRGFSTPDGARLRFRMVPIETAPSINLPGSAIPAASATMAFRISVALLDVGDAVAKDSAGALLISPPHEITLQPGLMVEGVNIAAAIDLELRKVAREFEARVTQRRAVVDFLKAKWGGSLPAPVVAVPVVPIPVSPIGFKRP